jgi:hypothetical protein
MILSTRQSQKRRKTASTSSKRSEKLKKPKNRRRLSSTSVNKPSGRFWLGKMMRLRLSKSKRPR